MDRTPAVGIRVSALSVQTDPTGTSNVTALVSIGQTDQEGRFRLENIPAGRYHVMAGSLDLPTYYPGTLVIGNAAVVVVESGSPVSNINFALRIPDARLSGRLVPSRSSAATANVQLRLMGRGAQVSETLTSSEGAFEFLKVPPGSYEIVAVGRAFEALPDPVKITVTDKDVRGIAVVMPPSFQVSGRLVFPANQEAWVNPVLELAVLNADGGNRGGNVRDIRELRNRNGFNLAPDGTFVFPSVRPGTYGLGVTSASRAGGPFPARQTVVVSDKDISGLEIAFPLRLLVGIMVTVDDGGAAPQFSVTFADGRVNQSVNVNRGKGVYGAQLPEGDYRVSVSDLPDGYRLESILTGSTDLVTQTLKVSGANPNAEIMVRLKGSASVKVSGRVTGFGGAVLRPDWIAFRGVGINAVFEAAVQADGTFELSGVSPGRYVVSVYPTRSAIPADLSLVVGDKNVTGVEFALPPLKELIGRVLVDGVRPLPAFQVSLTGPVSSPEGAVATAPTSSGVALLLNTRAPQIPPGSNLGLGAILWVPEAVRSDGTFRILLPEGTYGLNVALPGLPDAPSAYRLAALTYGSVNLFREPLKITAAADPSELRFTFTTKPASSWSRVEGYVSGLGTPQAARVLLTGAAITSTEAELKTDGTFEFLNVPPGAYLVRALPSHAFGEVSIRVEGGDVRNVEIPVRPLKDVRMRAAVDGGAALPGFVLLLSSAGAGMSLNPQLSADGSSRISLPQGEYRLSIGGLPDSYAVKSFTYGSTDLMKEGVKVAATDNAELQIVFESTRPKPVVHYSGRVVGLGSRYAPDRITLTGAALAVSYETVLKPDGSFDFPNVQSGTYLFRVLSRGAAEPMLVAATTVTVPGVDLQGVDVSVDYQPDIPSRVDTRVNANGFPNDTRSGSSKEALAVELLRTVTIAEESYLASNGKYGDLESLKAAGLLDSRLTRSPAFPLYNGYRFTVTVTGPNYLAIAVPLAEPDGPNGRYAFFCQSDALIRYAASSSLAPASKNGSPIDLNFYSSQGVRPGNEVQISGSSSSLRR